MFGNSPPELRILVEAQGESPTLGSVTIAGKALNEALVARGADLTRFRQVEDLFFPESPEGRFTLWHAVVLSPDKEPSFRVYLNPQVNGEHRAYATVEQALTRLGFTDAWETIAAAASRSPPSDELRYFSLDLSSDARARIKVYIYHHGATAVDLERAASFAQNHVPGAATEFCKAMAGTTGPFLDKPPATCLAFVQGERRPTTATLHVPIRFYSESDLVARERIHAYFVQKGLSADAYDRVLEGVVRRPLDGGSGLHTYASLRTEPQGSRVTLYLATEAYQTMPSRQQSPAPLPAPSPEALVELYEKQSIAEHPFFQRMRREPVDVGTLWTLLVNVREGIVKHFSRRLAHVVDRVEEGSIRAMLAKQLNDELGDGDASRAHALLFDRLIDGLEPFRPAVVPPDVLAPGQEWSRRLEQLYIHGSAHEGIGAAMVIEIVGKQADCFIGDEFRRQNSVPKSSLEWLDLHEDLEQEHSNESMEIARMVSPDERIRAQVGQGARECGAACWAFLDGMYRLCYRDVYPRRS